MKKIAEITLLFWVMKICATMLGGTAGDLLAQTLNVGYGLSSLILIGVFLVLLVAQLAVSRYLPALYWAVILATSTAGTAMSDYMDRTLGLGFATGSLILVSILAVVLGLWWLSEKSLSLSKITTRRGELFYWTAILFSNTLGDYLADDFGLCFGGGALHIGALLLVLVLSYYVTRISRVLLFWAAFVLTRPFGATFGNLLTKSPADYGLGFGTRGSSLILLGLLVGLVVYASLRPRLTLPVPRGNADETANRGIIWLPN